MPRPKDRLTGFFAESYRRAREGLLADAGARGLRVESHLLDLPGREGEPLAMDVVREGPMTASRVLLTTSGVHGVEGFCGSAIQRGLLADSPRPADAEDLAIVHVHAVNPHGFSHLRRVTQENVDLNRNFIDFSQSLPVKADYSLLHPYLLPEQWPPSAGNEAALAAAHTGWDARRLQLAVTGGQHSHADGLFFGGTAPTWSNRVFRQILRDHLGAAAHVAWIDLHTGLGPWGVGERIYASFDPGATLDRARRWWGEGITSVHTGTSTSIPMTGPIQMAIYDECPGSAYTGICLEFGTVPPSEMHAALRGEHWLHNHPGADAAQAAVIKSRLLAAFYPQGDAWKRMVWEQGMQCAREAVDGLLHDVA